MRNGQNQQFITSFIKTVERYLSYMFQIEKNRVGIGVPISLIFLVTIMSVDAGAQNQSSDNITVKQAVQEAVEKNLSLFAEQYNISIADAELITAGLRPNPVLSIGGDHLDLLGTGYNDINGAGPPEYSVRMDWLIERGKKRQRRIEVAENAREVTRLQVLNATRTLTLEVQNSFVEVISAKVNLRLAEENLKSFKNIVQINDVRVNAGDLAKIELTRTKLAALQLQNQVLQAQLRLRTTKQKLQFLMGRTVPSEQFDVIEDLRRDPLPLKQEELELQALNSRLDLQALKRDQARSQAEIKSQLAQGKIDYTIGMEYRRQQGLAGKGNSLGFFFSIPLPVFNRNQGEIERSNREQDQIVARIRTLEVQIANDVRNAWRQYDTANSILSEVEGEMLGQARQVLDTMEYSYKRGAVSFVEFIDAQRSYNEMMLGYNEARAEYARSLYLIDSIIGKETGR